MIIQMKIVIKLSKTQFVNLIDELDAVDYGKGIYKFFCVDFPLCVIKAVWNKEQEYYQCLVAYNNSGKDEIYSLILNH